jgi:hypothetical protein
MRHLKGYNRFQSFAEASTVCWVDGLEYMIVYTDQQLRHSACHGLLGRLLLLSSFPLRLTHFSQIWRLFDA